MHIKYCFLIKSYVVPLVLFGTISEGWAAGIEEIASKFQQNDYKFNLEFGEVVRYNKRELKFLNFIVFKHNRTTTALNVTIQYNFDVGNDLEVVTQAYKFASNEFRLFPLRLQIGFCYAIATNIVGSQGIFKCGNFTQCPFKKGIRYHSCNWTPDESKFPPFMPTGRYMYEIQGLYKSTELYFLKIYTSVERPIAWE